MHPEKPCTDDEGRGFVSRHLHQKVPTVSDGSYQPLPALDAALGGVRCFGSYRQPLLAAQPLAQIGLDQ